MILSHVTPERIELRRFRPTRAPLLVGFALFALAALPLLSPGPLTLWRVLTSAVLVLSAVVVIQFTRPRSSLVVLHVKKRVLERDGLEIPLGQCAVQLVGALDEETQYPGAVYRAVLLLPDGSRELLLERPDPAAVLSDLTRIREVLPLPTRVGWGLPLDAKPWVPPEQKATQPAREFAPIEMTALRYPSQRAAAVTTLIGGIGTATAMGIMMDAQRDRHLPVSALSLVLAGATVILILLIGAFIATDRLRIHGKSELTIERRALGIVWKQQVVERTALRHVWAVGPDPTQPRHLLLQLDDNLLALRCIGEQARRLHAQLDT